MSNHFVSSMTKSNLESVNYENVSFAFPPLAKTVRALSPVGKCLLGHSTVKHMLWIPLNLLMSWSIMQREWHTLLFWHNPQSCVRKLPGHITNYSTGYNRTVKEWDMTCSGGKVSGSQCQATNSNKRTIYGSIYEWLQKCFVVYCFFYCCFLLFIVALL